MIFDMDVQFPKFEGLRYQDIVQLLRFYRDDIGQAILDHIEARTPKLTGALREDEAYQPLGGTGGILQWYLGTENQLGEWGRVYGPYQEGKPLGLDGYTATGAPYQMFQKVTTDDLPEIQSWAEGVVQEAVDNVFQPI